jgi:hypothetical protein
MSDLLLLVASSGDSSEDSFHEQFDADRPWPRTSRGATEWAKRLHDGLAAQRPFDATQAAERVGSWLRTQSVGRDTIVVTEPRVADFATLWAAGATLAGVGETRLASRADDRRGATRVEPAPAGQTAAASSRTTHAPSRRRMRIDQARLWAVDRVEDAARLAVRAFQR